MATLIQLSETLTINLDTVTVLRYENGQWLLFFTDANHACTLTPDESAVLAHYLLKHTSKLSYTAVRREQSRGRWQEPRI